MTDQIGKGLCAFCYDERDLVEPPCEEKPEKLLGQPIGMYHCKDCGSMVLAGLPHPWLCRRCADRVSSEMKEWKEKNNVGPKSE